MYRSLHTYSQPVTPSIIYLSVCFIYLKLELSKRPASNDNNFKYPVRKIDKCVLFNEVIITHKHLITYRELYFGVKLWPLEILRLMLDTDLQKIVS